MKTKYIAHINVFRHFQFILLYYTRGDQISQLHGSWIDLIYFECVPMCMCKTELKCIYACTPKVSQKNIPLSFLDYFKLLVQ